MAYFSGSTATIHWAATGGVAAEESHIIAWSLTTACNVSKFATNSTSGWKDAVAGVKEWSGTITGVMDDTDGVAFDEGDAILIELHVDGDDDNYYSGTGIISGFSTDVDIKEGPEQEWEIQFEGKGALTRTGASVT